jgi:hypothetical protein
MNPAAPGPKIPENGPEPEFRPEFLRNFEPSAFIQLHFTASKTADSGERRTAEAFIIYCTGLEHLLSRDPRESYHAIREARREHSHIVLRAERSGVYSPESLARIARESSKSARDQARKFAKVAASIL